MHHKCVSIDSNRQAQLISLAVSAHTKEGYDTAPEQNFLSQYFTWKESLHWKYNFQWASLLSMPNREPGAIVKFRESLAILGNYA